MKILKSMKSVDDVYRFRCSAKEANFLSIASKRIKGVIDVKVGPRKYGGCFNFPYIEELYIFIRDYPQLATNFCFSEKKTEVFKFFVDFDINEEILAFLEEHEYFLMRNFWDYCIRKLVDSLNHFIDNVDGVDFNYVYLGRDVNHKIHLIFPHLFVTKTQAATIRKKTIELMLADNRFRLTAADIELIYDESVYRDNGLRIIKQSKPNQLGFYSINKDLSTFGPICDDLIQQFKLTSIRSDFTESRCRFRLNGDYCPLIDKFIGKKKKEALIDCTDEFDFVKPVEQIADKPIDTTINLDLVIELLNNCKLERFERYKTWIQFAFFCKNYGLYEICTRFSERTKTYNKAEIDRIFQTGDSPKKVSIATIYKWSKEDDEQKHKKILQKYQNIVKYKSTDDILLKDFGSYRFKSVILEDSKYISDQAKLRIIKTTNKKGVVLLMGRTGIGKTTALTKIIKDSNPSPSILAVTSRVVMSITLMEIEELGLTSYKMKKNNKNKFIISLEQITSVDRNHHVLILDEFNSLIKHFYSSTMDGRSRNANIKLVQLIRDTPLVICADATFTDMSLKYITQIRDDCVFYRNSVQNRADIPLFTYNCTKKDMAAHINQFLRKKARRLIENGESCLIMSDSKKTANHILTIVRKWNPDSDYFKLYTKDCGDLDKIMKYMRIITLNKRKIRSTTSKKLQRKLFYLNRKLLNEIGWAGRCVIFSPKIVNGFNILVEYERVFIIYRGGSIDPIDMYQQIGRARNGKEFHLLWMERDYSNKNNYYVSYEKNKQIEDNNIDNYIKGLPTHNGQPEGIFQSSEYDTIFRNSHYYKTWYDRLFRYNKAQLLLDLLKEQGFNLHKKDFKINGTTIRTFARQQQKFSAELEHHAQRVIKEEILDENVDDDLSYYVEYDEIKKNMTDEVKRRLQLIGKSFLDLQADKNLLEFISTTSFDAAYRAATLYFKTELVNEEEVDSVTTGLLPIEKDNIDIGRIRLITWLENRLGINRFAVDQINIDGKRSKAISKKLSKVSALLPYLLRDNTRGTIKKKLIEKKLESLDNSDAYRRLMKDLYNSFDDIITTRSIQRQINNVRSREYAYEINMDAVTRHVNLIKMMHILNNYHEIIMESLLIYFPTE